MASLVNAKLGAVPRAPLAVALKMFAWTTDVTGLSAPSSITPAADRVTWPPSARSEFPTPIFPAVELSVTLPAFDWITGKTLSVLRLDNDTSLSATSELSLFNLIEPFVVASVSFPASTPIVASAAERSISWFTPVTCTEMSPPSDVSDCVPV